MAEQEIKFNIANNQASGLNYGARVDLIVTYDPATPNTDGSFTATAARGTYTTLDVNGNAVETNQITQLAPIGQFGHLHDNRLFINSDPSTSPIVTYDGIGFNISNPANTEDNDGFVNFYDKDGDVARNTPPTNIPDYGLTGTNNGNPATDISTNPVCFVTGTLIRTVRGDVAVEDLQVGDTAITASGGLRPITWIGHRHLDAGNTLLPSALQPVRVRAGAFGPNLPARDLRLSPGHPVLVGADADGGGGHLVPIMCLINGTSITREALPTITYWHVELDSHDILLAEGLPAESYLDWGDRPFFDEASDHALHSPDFIVPGLAARCRPVAVDGPVVEAERARLSAVFAATLGRHCVWDEAERLSWLAA